MKIKKALLIHYSKNIEIIKFQLLYFQSSPYMYIKYIYLYKKVLKLNINSYCWLHTYLLALGKHLPLCLTLHRQKHMVALK